MARTVRWGDVARAIDIMDILNQGSWLNGAAAIALAIQHQRGANTVEVMDAIRAVIPQIEALLLGPRAAQHAGGGVWTHGRDADPIGRQKL